MRDKNQISKKWYPANAGFLMRFFVRMVLLKVYMRTSLKAFFIIIFIALSFYGVNKILRQTRVGIVTPKFVEYRNDVAGLLKRLASTPDTDLTKLGSFEQRQDWVGALKALDGSVKVNDELLDMTKLLVSKTDLVLVEAEKIQDVVLRPQAISAVLELQVGNKLMLDYFKARAGIFDKLNKYYSDWVIQGKAEPVDLSSDFANIDDLIKRAREAYKSFNEKIDVFDRAAGLK